MSDSVTLTIPCAPEYVSVVRLTILGVASRLGFSYDAVEDIRLAVAEACTNAIARARRAEKLDAPVTLRAFAEADRLVIEVTGAGVEEPGVGEEDADDAGEFGGAELGLMLMGICMDEVTTERTPEGSRVRLVKFNDRPAARKSMERRE
jgi:serine/threonine-protein kinase RsbW